MNKKMCKMFNYILCVFFFFRIMVKVRFSGCENVLKDRDFIIGFFFNICK